MEIETLSRCTPMLDTKEWNSEYAKVLHCREITFTTNVDVNLNLRVVFSVDGKHDGQEHKFKLTSGWSSRSIKRSLPYCKVVITNETGLINDTLTLSVIGDKAIKQEDKPPAEVVAEIEEHRSKSPFRSILSKRRKSIPAKQDTRCKVPEHVPNNGILVGDYGNLKSIPPPIAGINEIQLLTFQNNKFEWVILTDDERKDKNVSWRFD